MENLIELDSYRDISDIIKREVKSQKIVFGYLTDDNEFVSYIDHEISYLELLFIIDSLQTRKEDMFDK